MVPSRVPSNGASQKAIMGTSLLSTDATIGGSETEDSIFGALCLVSLEPRGIVSTAGGLYMIC
jgi:hypothetical protein